MLPRLGISVTLHTPVRTKAPGLEGRLHGQLYYIRITIVIVTLFGKHFSLSLYCWQYCSLDQYAWIRISRQRRRRRRRHRLVNHRTLCRRCHSQSHFAWYIFSDKINNLLQHCRKSGNYISNWPNCFKNHPKNEYVRRMSQQQQQQAQPQAHQQLC